MYNLQIFHRRGDLYANEAVTSDFDLQEEISVIYPVATITKTLSIQTISCLKDVIVT